MESPTEHDESLPDPIHPNRTWLLARFVFRIAFTVWFRFRARGLENLPADSGALILCNHQSFLDPLLLQVALNRPIGFLARDSLWKVPFIGWVLRKHYCVPISRESAGASSIRDSVRRMRHGFLICVFPEGTRTRDGSVGKFLPGFVAIARRGKLPVIPAGIAGAYNAMPRGSWFLRPRSIRVVYGEPLSPEELEPLYKRGREADLVALTRQRVAECQQEAEDWLKSGDG